MQSSHTNVSLLLRHPLPSSTVTLLLHSKFLAVYHTTGVLYSVSSSQPTFVVLLVICFFFKHLLINLSLFDPLLAVKVSEAALISSIKGITQGKVKDELSTRPLTMSSGAVTSTLLTTITTEEVPAVKTRQQTREQVNQLYLVTLPSPATANSISSANHKVLEGLSELGSIGGGMDISGWDPFRLTE